MSRKKGPDPKKIENIKNALKKYPEGLCVRELAIRSGVDKSSVSRYLTIYMKDDIRTQRIGKLLKLIKLKR
ncbi:MAG: hypothetical protein HZB67_06060 [Candidatus Aenigmarchaeota archaeon]|nr:hypothetical protein [Candidatus Aenigmarchaeota archaeon]